MPDLNVFDSITAQDVFLGFRFDVLIDGTIFDASEQGNNSPGVVFTNADVGYVFYVDANGDFVYRKTIDGGLQFGSPVVVFTDAIEAVHGYAVWYDRWTPGRTGTEIHITWMVTDKSIRYRSLDTNGDALGTESNVATGLGVVSSTSLFPSITISTIGNIFVSGGTAGVSANRDIWKSEDGGSTFSATTPAFISGASDEIQLIATSESDGDICAVQLNSNIKDLESIIYDETTNAWQTPVVIDGDFVNNIGKHRFGWGGALDELSGDIYVVGSNDPNSASNDIRAYRFSSGVWSTLTDVFTNVGAENSISHPFVDRCGNVFAIYTRGAAGAELGFFKKSTDKGVTWSDEVLFGVSPDDVTITRPVPQGDNAYSIGYNNDLDSLLGASLEISDLCLKSEETFDSITVTEDVAISIDRGFSVFDALTAIEFIDVFLDQLFIDVQEPFSILIDEFVELLDLIVEVGIVADSTLATENVSLFLDELFVSVDDGVSIIETVNVSINPLIFSGQDSLLVSEFFNAITFSSPIDIEADEDVVSVAEFALLDLLVNLSVDDTVTIIEDVTVLLGVLVPSVSDTITIVESVQILDIVVELTVDDAVGVAEDATALIDVLFLDVSDAVSVADVAILTDIIVELGPAFDTVTIVEQATTLLVELNITVDENITVTEFEEILTNFLELFVIEPFDVLISEQISVFDENVGVGPVVDVIAPVTDSATMLLDVLGINVKDFPINPVFDVQVAEVLTVSLDLNLAVDEPITVTEAPQVGLALLLAVDEAVGATEAIVVVVGDQNLAVSDQITVTEFANVFDIIIELEASEAVTVDEDVALDTGVVILSASDAITVTEVVTLAVVALPVGLNISATETIAVGDSGFTRLPDFEDFPCVFDVTPRKRFFTIDVCEPIARC